MRPLPECDACLRAVVQAQDFEGSQKAITEYRQSFDATWNKMSDAERRGSELPERATVLMSWALCMITLFRTGLYAQRRSAKAAGRYIQNGRSGLGHTWGTAG